MKLGWGGRQTIALLILAVVLVSISLGLQLTHVLRLATESAASESELITQALLRQIGYVAAARPAEPQRALQEDPRIDLVLQAATAHAPAVVFVAIYDSSQTAIAHTTQGMIGSRLESLEPLPSARGTWESLRFLRSLARSPQVYRIDTPLLLGGSPFATIRVGLAGVLLREQVVEAFRRGLAGALVQIGLAVALGFVLAGIASRRLRQIEAGVTALREGRFDSRIPESGVDEFSRLARDLNLLSEQFQKERQDRDSHLGSFRQTVELLGEGVMTLGPDREVFLMNGPTGRILGIDPSRAKGSRIDEILAEDHPVRLLADRLYAAGAGEGSGPLTVPMPMRNGGRSYAAIGHRIMGGDAPAGVLIEFKEMAALEELHSMTDHSRVLSRLGQMAAGVAHEIRNPLQTINLELGILRGARHLSPEEVDLHVKTALEEIQRLQRAVSGFLKVARLRSLAPAPLQLNELLEEVHQSMEAEANLSGLDLDLDLCADLPATRADREVLRQAIQNLVKNAVQALPSRGRRITLTTRKNDSEILVSVTDTGPGIRPEDQGRVFDLYFTTKEGGTGVGLALVRQALEMHGGDVELRSTPGEGTVVTLRLPIRVPAMST
jgi:two-component system, NtrC family, sensor histidine kinase HydH